LLASLPKAKWQQHFSDTNEKTPDHQAKGSKVCFGKRATRLSNRVLA
jgi:hypothetical protein